MTLIRRVAEEGLMATHDEETMNYFQGTELLPGHRRSLRDVPPEPRRLREHRAGPADLHHVYAPLHAGAGAGPVEEADRQLRGQAQPLQRPLRHATPLAVPDAGQCTTTTSTSPTSLRLPSPRVGPGEPWHDIHCCLESPVAWDVLYNFEQRWHKQGGKDLLIQLQDLIIPPSPVTFPEDGEAWDVHLFRSIDTAAPRSVSRTPPDDATSAWLVSGKDQIIDRSIQDAYIHAIRRARSFIYIENQYFLVSSYCWKPDGIRSEDILRIVEAPFACPS